MQDGQVKINANIQGQMNYNYVDKNHFKEVL
jgi:hypothetical protein